MDLKRLYRGRTILVVEDESELRKQISTFLSRRGADVRSASNGLEGLEYFRQLKPDIVVTDIRMPHMDGLEMASSIKELSRDIPIVVVTAFSDKEYLLKAIEVGVDGYVRKPVDFEELVSTLNRLMHHIGDKMPGSGEEDLPSTLGNSGIARLSDEMKAVAESELSILIEGETGVGKSYLAKVIHKNSARRSGTFISLNMGAIPENLMESELFGHVKGAFTGASAERRGFFRSAEGGTLFLDDIQNAPISLQVKLLKALEEREIFPVGSSSPVSVDVRVIAAANEPLKSSIAEGKFRRDLYYRVGEYSVNLEPLRNRPSDIKYFSELFLYEAASEMKKDIRSISKEALLLFLYHEWKGNLRELKNVIRRGVLFSSTRELSKEDLCRALSTTVPEEEFNSFDLETMERRMIEKALTYADGKKTEAAKLLGVNYKTLISKLKKYSL